MENTIVAVSFGTTHADAERDCIAPVEEALRRAFPGWNVRRAWTSRVICRRMGERGTPVQSEAEALAELRASGGGRVVVASTHIIPGQEYDRVLSSAEGLPVSAPLLDTDGDLAWMAGLLSGIAQEEERTLLVMGHGTEHRANAAYARLREKLPGSVKLACVEGDLSLEGIMGELEAVPGKKLTLMPMMLVAGDHARNDLAGPDGDSWKSRLEARGFDVRVRLQGLGALEAVRARFVEKVRATMEA